MKRFLIAFLLAGAVQGQTNLLTWTDNGTNVTITGNSITTETTVVIPDEIDGLPVTVISDDAFYSCTSLASISLPAGLTSIGLSAFYGCTSLTSISLPDGLTSIGAFAFEECTSLTSLYFDGNAPTVGFGAFLNVSGTVYYSPDATGFTDPWNGLEAKKWWRVNIAHRPDLTPEQVVPTAEMPYSLWTNSVLWLTAESPVLNAGTTNANWLCYAKTCAGNATQTTIASQPTTIVTNGVKALSFDGRDWLTSTYTDRTNYTLACWARITTTNAVGLVSRSGSAGLRTVIIYSGDELYAVFANNSTTNSSIYTTTQAIAQNTWVFLAVTDNGGSDRKIHFNASNVTLPSPITTTTLAESASTFYVGRNPAAAPNQQFLTGQIGDVYMFDRSLSTEELTALYNATKGRYGL